MEPIANGNNGRSPNGRFTSGNQGGPGNPYARRVADLRKKFLSCVTDDDLSDVVQSLVLRAKDGDLGATKLLLQYTLGRPRDIDETDVVIRWDESSRNLGGPK